MQASPSHACTTNVRCYLPFKSLGMYTVWSFSELHTHKNAQRHTVNTINAFSSNKNNIPPVLANANIYPARLRYSGHATWLRQKLAGLTVHSQLRLTVNEWNPQHCSCKHRKHYQGLWKCWKRQAVLTFSLCKSCSEHGKVNVAGDRSRCIPLLYCMERGRRREGGGKR